MIKAQSVPASAPIRHGLRAMGPADLPIVCGRLGEPHVTRWWPDPERALRSIARHLGGPAVERFILTIDSRDAGYLVYDPHHGPPTGAHAQTSIHPDRDPPSGARGIDLFIGGASFIGRGHGPRLMRRILDHLFEGAMRCENHKPMISP